MSSRGCAEPRLDQDGTWITPQIVEAYTALAELGYAHSVETWEDGELVGGLYGVAIGRMFFGESMFARRSDASKVAFVSMLAQLERVGHAAGRLPGPDQPSRVAWRARDPAAEPFSSRSGCSSVSRRCRRPGGSAVGDWTEHAAGYP